MAAPIKLDSRYSLAELKRDENDIEYLDWFGDIQFDVTEFTDNEEYQVQPGDTVFSVASRFLGLQKYYWVICRANTIFNPFQKLTPGDKLLIPSLKTFRTNILGQV